MGIAEQGMPCIETLSGDGRSAMHMCPYTPRLQQQQWGLHLGSEGLSREVGSLTAVQNTEQLIHICQLSGLIEGDGDGLVIQGPQVAALSSCSLDDILGAAHPNAHCVKEGRTAYLQAKLLCACIPAKLAC